MKPVSDNNELSPLWRSVLYQCLAEEVARLHLNARYRFWQTGDHVNGYYSFCRWTWGAVFASALFLVPWVDEDETPTTVSVSR